MMETLATKTSLPRRKMSATFQAVRAEALFASDLPASGPASRDQVRRAVTDTLRRLGIRGCAAAMASEFGDHPDIAVARMSWALATICTVYTAPSSTATATTTATPTPTRRPLALAS